METCLIHKTECVAARKKALDYIGLPPDSDVPYTWLAREVAAKDKKVIIGFDLFNKASCAGFLRLWARKQ